MRPSLHSARSPLAIAALLVLSILAGACTDTAGDQATVASGDVGGDDSVSATVAAAPSTTSSTTSSVPATTAAPTTTAAPSITTTTAPDPEWAEVTCDNGVVVSYQATTDGSTRNIDDLCSDVDDGEPTPHLDFCEAWWPDADLGACLAPGEKLFAACLAQADPAAEESVAMGFVVDCLIAGEELLARDELFGMCGPDLIAVVTDDGTTCVSADEESD